MKRHLSGFQFCPHRLHKHLDQKQMLAFYWRANLYKEIRFMCTLCRLGFAFRLSHVVMVTWSKFTLYQVTPISGRHLCIHARWRQRCKKRKIYLSNFSPGWFKLCVLPCTDSNKNCAISTPHFDHSPVRISRVKSATFIVISKRYEIPASKYLAKYFSLTMLLISEKYP